MLQLQLCTFLMLYHNHQQLFIYERNNFFTISIEKKLLRRKNLQRLYRSCSVQLITYVAWQRQLAKRPYVLLWVFGIFFLSFFRFSPLDIGVSRPIVNKIENGNKIACFRIQSLLFREQVWTGH